MKIKILPPELANHIAAGELVESPASVVKELLENSIDAGATRVNISIERGGTKMIRVRDNGSGIGKDEVALALARHATSKISCMEDFSRIRSMGFRGEALASVKSVSRLVLTSRIASQDEGWQVYSDGDKEVTIKPVAHTIGTTVEVQDLFYNKPARRKFMRTEKTEFAHIEEVIRRLAIAMFDITFILQHNGKAVRQYCAVSKKEDSLKRSGICGSDFVGRSLAVSWKNESIYIHGWVAYTDVRYLQEMQYSYVNKRMIRSKVINHAIRQAYNSQLEGKQQPVFVLFLEVAPQEVDVNVHPTKDEVRFNQARLVHDWIYEAIVTVIKESGASSKETVESAVAKKNLATSNLNTEIKNAPISLQVIEGNKEDAKIEEDLGMKDPTVLGDKHSLGSVLKMYQPCYALLESAGRLSLISLDILRRCLIERKLTHCNNKALLIPLRMKLRPGEASALNSYQALLQKMGIVLQYHKYQAILEAVPLQLHKQNLQNLITELLGYLQEEVPVTKNQIAAWLSRRINLESITWSYSLAIELLADASILCPDLFKTPKRELWVKLTNIDDAINALKNAKIDTTKQTNSYISDGSYCFG